MYVRKQLGLANAALTRASKSVLHSTTIDGPRSYSQARIDQAGRAALEQGAAKGPPSTTNCHLASRVLAGIRNNWAAQGSAWLPVGHNLGSSAELVGEAYVGKGSKWARLRAVMATTMQRFSIPEKSEQRRGIILPLREYNASGMSSRKR